MIVIERRRECDEEFGYIDPLRNDKTKNQPKVVEKLCFIVKITYKITPVFFFFFLLDISFEKRIKSSVICKLTTKRIFNNDINFISILSKNPTLVSGDTHFDT